MKIEGILKTKNCLKPYPSYKEMKFCDAVGYNMSSKTVFP